MSILTDMRAALDEVTRTLDVITTGNHSNYPAALRAYQAAYGELQALLIANAAHLLDVAEALKGECNACAAYGTTADECERCDTGTALAQLVKEADHDRA